LVEEFVEVDQTEVKYRFFTVPAHTPEAAQEELNRFWAEQSRRSG
jgi:hypothetical protein